MSNKEKWNNYFVGIINKYNLKMSKKNPIVIFIDGKNITSNKNYNLTNEEKNSFNDVFEQTIKYFSNEFNCIAISGVDEVSFVIEDYKKIQKNVTKGFKAQDIASIFSQYFFEKFNSAYKGQTVYFHCKCSNIPKGKIKSYIKHRSMQIFELQLTYFLKRKQIKDAGKIKLSEKIEKCNQFSEYKDIKSFEKGRLYIKNKQIDIDNFLNGNIVNVPETIREEAPYFLDITNI